METITLFAIVASIVLFLLLVLYVVLFIRKSSSYNKIYSRFKGIIDIEAEQEKAQKRYGKMLQDYKETAKSLQQKEQELKKEYQKKRSIYDRLVQEISVLDEDLGFISYGIYKPHFDFDASEKYKEKIREVRNRQKELVRKKQAAVCSQKWTVSGSKAEGRKMTNRNIRLMLRAFNNECDSAILKVKWNNVLKMEQRIKKACRAINKLGEPTMIKIMPAYLNLKLEELYLAHERQEKLYEEKEEQRRIREQIREEEKVQREIEQAKREAEREEKRYQKALERARNEISQAHGDDLTKLNEQLKQLEGKLRQVQDMKERAISRAQITKSGYIYVISNIGSFGDNIYKIGMTRRLEPMDRVRELGDASVPFRFDVHAMIYSENAPELENKLHHIFDDKRLNLINRRREFFNISLDEIEKAVRENYGEIEFTKLAEAREFRESAAIKLKEEKARQHRQEMEKKFPASI
ncbi:MAG: DUF4041 domain-containing protein [Chloroflexi bacterium]|nr:MAG: DUF4041 domain-containing protein [Chloroflexota bacterium]